LQLAKLVKIPAPDSGIGQRTYWKPAYFCNSSRSPNRIPYWV